MLAICMAGKNAVGDSYKNILNEFPNKKFIICVIPEGYRCKEFSDDFSQIIIDEVSHARKRFIKAIFFAYFLRNIVKKNKIKKIFIYYDNHWFNIILFIMLIDLKVKFSLWIHDPTLHIGANWKDKFIRQINRVFLFRYVHKFIVSYHAAIQELKVNYGIPEFKITVVFLPEMKEMEFKDIKDREVKKEYDFIFFGRIEKYKGIERFIDALNGMPNKKGIIIGKGSYSNIIFDKMRSNSNIEFINQYLENRKLALYIKKSKFCILPYKIATGSQTVQISNYYNVPVIAMNTGCFGEYIKNGVNGFLVEDNEIDKFERLMKIIDGEVIDNDKMCSFLEENFSVNKIAKKLWEYINY